MHVLDIMYMVEISQRTLAMFVGVVALRYQHHITKCHNSHKHIVRANNYSSDRNGNPATFSRMFVTLRKFKELFYPT